ncbi:MAG: GNVR domain-containing protein, partial [bacterium]
SEVTMIAEDNTGGSRASGLLAQFGGLAGINLGGAQPGEIISPQLYPNIVHSTPFMLNILEHTVYFSNDDKEYKIYDYFSGIYKSSLMGNIKEYTIGLPGKILGLFRIKEQAADSLNVRTKEGPIKLSKKQHDIINGLKDRLNISLDEETGIIKVSTVMPDPYAAAELADLIVKDMTSYIIDYKISKAQVDLAFVQVQYEDAKNRFEKAQEKLAGFRDKNFNVVSARARTEEERLQAEYDLAFNVYNGLAQQLEQSKIEVQEKTPVFKVVDEAKVPVEKSKPRILRILIICIFIGFSLGTVIRLIYIININLS